MAKAPHPMESRSPTAILALVNDIGRPKGVRCKYEWDNMRRLFAYRFYRNGIYLGSTAVPSRVLSKMEKFTCAN